MWGGGGFSTNHRTVKSDNLTVEVYNTSFLLDGTEGDF